MKNENGFYILAADTKEKMISLGAASKTSTDRFDKCTQLLAAYLENRRLDFSLETGLEWLDTIEHSPSKIHDSSYTVTDESYIFWPITCAAGWMNGVCISFMISPYPSLGLIHPSCLSMNVLSTWTPMRRGPLKRKSRSCVNFLCT